MHSQLNDIRKHVKNLSYRYWVFTIKLKLYIKKYNRVLEMPYR